MLAHVGPNSSFWPGFEDAKTGKKGLRNTSRCPSIRRLMHRPTRQHMILAAKLERTAARSRHVGKKARRWKKWLEHYKALCQQEA